MRAWTRVSRRIPVAVLSGIFALGIATQTSLAQTATIGQRITFHLDGGKLANGIYLVQLATPAGVYAQKTAVLK